MDRQADILKDPIGKLILTFSIPAFLGIVINLLYGFIDGIVIGDGIGQNALGGVTVIFPLTLMMIAFASMIGEGLGSFVAREIVKDKSSVMKCIKTAFALMTWCIIIIVTMSLLFLDPLIRQLGAVEEIFVYAKHYYLSLLPGLPFMVWSLVYFHHLNAQGRIKTAMKAMMLSAGLNIILDIVFVYWFKWGVIGAGVATSIAQAYWFLHMHIHALRNQEIITLKMPFVLIVDKYYARLIITIGLSAFIRQIGITISLILINKLASSYDVIYVASFGATQRILRLVISPIAAVSTAFKPIVGQNYGKGQMFRVQKSIKYSIMATLVLGSILILIVILIREPLGRTFGIGSHDMNIFIRVLLLTSCLLPIYGVHHLAVAYFTALGMAKQAISLNIIKQIILLIPMVIILPKLFGVYGLFMALPLSDLLSIGIAYIMMKNDIAKLIMKDVPII